MPIVAVWGEFVANDIFHAPRMTGERPWVRGHEYVGNRRGSAVLRRSIVLFFTALTSAQQNDEARYFFYLISFDYARASGSMSRKWLD